ncbi:uncharacterized protein BJX67DRAFT_347920 [Aspergillus lucknowensis]|uniref:Uncharacterized protein n=1 Tax=Aspergillus lucknowensis TaxID=176173 RepID=A0ABR4LXP8_9EURO
MSPADVSIRNLTGDWTVDKSKSNNLDAVLKLQGIGWLRRKAVTSGTITLKINQHTDGATDGSSSGEAVTQLMMQQGLRGIFPGVEQTRALNWTEHEHVDAVSGDPIKVRSRFVSAVRTGDGKVRPVLEVETTGDKSSVEDHLGSAVVPAGEDGTGETIEKAFVQDLIVSGGKEEWTSEQIWAVEKIGDEVILSCKAVAAKGDSSEKAVLAYKFGDI